MATHSEVAGLIRDYMRLHYGLVTRQMAVAAGARPGWIQRRLTSGEWAIAQPRVYRDTVVPTVDHQRLLAAVWTAGPGALASHRSAAWLWGLLGRTLETIEISVPGTRLVQLREGIAHRSVDQPQGAGCERAGIPLTDPFRTLIDLGAVVPPWAVESAVDRAVAQRLLTVPTLATARDRISRQGIRGGGVLREVLEARGVQSDRHAPSVLESKAARLFKRAGLPDPKPELMVGASGEYRLDFAWPEVMLVAEVHGWAFHSSLAGFQADIDRANAVAAAGWVRLQYTWSDITRRSTLVAQQVARNYRHQERVLRSLSSPRAS